jgi:cytochrome c
MQGITKIGARRAVKNHIKAMKCHRSALGAMRLPQSLVGLDLRRRYREPLCRVSAPHMLCLWTMLPRYPCYWYVIQLHDRIVHVLEEFMIEAGVAKA